MCANTIFILSKGGEQSQVLRFQTVFESDFYSWRYVHFHEKKRQNLPQKVGGGDAFEIDLITGF